MTSFEFECSDHPVVAWFQSELLPAQLQRLRILSRNKSHRCAAICEEIADLADGWGNEVHFTLPERKSKPAPQVHLAR